MIRLFYFLCFLQFITLGLARTRVPGAMPILRAKLEKLVAVGQSTARYGKEEYRFNDLIQPLIIHGSFEDFYEMVESRRIATKTAGLLCMGSIIKPGALSVLDQSMKSAILVPEERSGEVIYTPLGAYAMDAMVALVNQGVTDSNFVLKPSELIKRLIEVLSDDRLT